MILTSEFSGKHYRRLKNPCVNGSTQPRGEVRR